LEVRRAILFGVTGVVLLGGGVGVGAAVSGARTVTKTLTAIRVRTETRRSTTTRVVVRRRLVSRTVTNTVTAQPPPQRGFDYGAFDGDFAVSGIGVSTDSIGTNHIKGQISYTGGLDCPVLSYVEISATFFDSGHSVVGTGLANFTSMAQGSWYPFDATADGGSVSSASAVISGAQC
jgi:hypothetical protein